MPRYIKYYTDFGSALQGVPDSLLEASEVYATILLATSEKSPLNQITRDPFQKAVIASAAYVYYDIFIIRAKPSPCTCTGN